MDPVKIKTLPRSNEKPKAGTPAPPVKSEPRSKAARGLIALSVVAFFTAVAGYLTSTGPGPEPKRHVAKEPAQAVDRYNASVSRHYYNAQLMEEMMKRKSQLDNQATAPRRGNGEPLLPEDNRSYGVQLDQENTAERLYEELNGNKGNYEDLQEKINARLANRKWINQMEREERVNFVKNFIRRAYDEGLEVQLDENLVVIGVRRINKQKTVNIDQVLERLARQGQ